MKKEKKYAETRDVLVIIVNDYVYRVKTSRVGVDGVKGICAVGTYQ